MIQPNKTEINNSDYNSSANNNKKKTLNKYRLVLRSSSINEIDQDKSKKDSFQRFSQFKKSNLEANSTNNSGNINININKYNHC